MMTMIGIISLLGVVGTIVWGHMLALKSFNGSYMNAKKDIATDLAQNEERGKLVAEVTAMLSEHKAYVDVMTQAAKNTVAIDKKEEKKDIIVTESGDTFQFQGLDLFS